MKIVRKAKKGFTLIELMIVVAIIGLLAALAIPNFLKFQARAKTSEAKTNLKGLYTAQKSYLAEHDGYATDFDECGFAPERGNRYAVWMGDGAASIDRSATTGVEVKGVAPTLISVDLFKVGPTACTGNGLASCTNATAVAPAWAVQGTNPNPPAFPVVGTDATFHAFSAAVYGDIDSDTSIDGWYISSSSALVAATAAACVAATNAAEGSPTNVFNDVDC